MFLQDVLEIRFLLHQPTWRVIIYTKTLADVICRWCYHPTFPVLKTLGATLKHLWVYQACEAGKIQWIQTRRHAHRWQTCRETLNDLYTFIQPPTLPSQSPFHLLFNFLVNIPLSHPIVFLNHRNVYTHTYTNDVDAIHTTETKSLLQRHKTTARSIVKKLCTEL